jgi:hypothetical protein
MSMHAKTVRNDNVIHIFVDTDDGPIVLDIQLLTLSDEEKRMAPKAAELIAKALNQYRPPLR